MAILLTFVLACIGLASADVAHLARSYLPPSRLVASPEFSGSRTSSFTAAGGYSDRLVQAAPAPAPATSYIAPAPLVRTYSERLVQAAPAPTTTYIAPAPLVSTYSERLVQAAPAKSYIAPATASFTRTNLVSEYSAPARLTAPVAQTFTASQNYVAPAAQSFVQSAPSAAFTAQKFTSARLAAPSREYLTPEVETFEPIVQQSYTAPAAAYSAPASSSAFTSGVDTQYAADGGYVY